MNGLIPTDDSVLDFPGEMRYASRMDRDKFIRKAAKRSGFSVEEYEQFFDVTPCECGKKKCKGWQVRWKFGAERRREGNA